MPRRPPAPDGFTPAPDGFTSAPDGDMPSLFAAAPLPVAVLSPPERLACLRLIRSENVGPVTFREMINHFGGAEQALDGLVHIARRAGHGRPVKVCPKAAAEAELEAAERAGATPVFTIEPGYPRLLAEVDVPPPLVYVKGQASLLSKPLLAVVGSRQCSAAGTKLASTLTEDLSAAGFIIASGLARGIDAVAHRVALARGTVAVLAGGIDVIYPPEHASLHADIAQAGCLVTEMAPGYQPRGQDFPRRNRIISGISLGVVIVEAAKRSGTLVTARYAAEQGREVFAVPGHPLDPRAEGTNKLIQDGAKMVMSAADVLAEVEPMLARYHGSAPSGAAEDTGRRMMPDTWQAPPDRPPTPKPAMDDGAVARVLEALGPHPIDIDAITRATGLSSRAVQIALLELDLGGRIERHGAQLVSLKSALPGAP